MVWEKTSELTVHNIKESFKIIKLREKELMCGPIKALIKDIGKITKCMVKGLLHGLMEGTTPVIMFEIKNMVLELLHGQMVLNISESGIKVNNMGKERL